MVSRRYDSIFADQVLNHLLDRAMLDYSADAATKASLAEDDSRFAAALSIADEGWRVAVNDWAYRFCLRAFPWFDVIREAIDGHRHGLHYQALEDAEPSCPRCGETHAGRLRGQDGSKVVECACGCKYEITWTLFVCVEEAAK